MARVRQSGRCLVELFLEQIINFLVSSGFWEDPASRPVVMFPLFAKGVPGGDTWAEPRAYLYGPWFEGLKCRLRVAGPEAHGSRNFGWPGVDSNP